MKTDTQIQHDLFDELQWDPRLRDAEVGIAVKGGVVTLSGTVHTLGQKIAAERAAERVSGVMAVADDLMVAPKGTFARTDTELAHAAVSALVWDTEVPDDRIKVKVENGWITLTGKVPWQFQAASAEGAVRYLNGARGVTNLIHIEPTVSAPEVQFKIESALKRSAELDAKRIAVEASEGRVILRGSVRSWAERRDAERAAWSAPGVKLVDDQLVVST